MGKRKLRRSVSMRPGPYERLQAIAAHDGESMAAVVESLVNIAAARRGLEVRDEDAKERAREANARRERERAEEKAERELRQVEMEQMRADTLAQMQREAFGL